MGKSEGRIELDRLFIEGFRAREIVVPAIGPVKNLVRLQVEQIGVAGSAVGFALDPLLFAGGEGRLKAPHDLLREFVWMANTSVNSRS